MTFDGSAEADIRGVDIDKLVRGFGKLIPTFKNFCNKSKTASREIRWYRKGLTLATAMNPLDTITTQGITGSMMSNVASKARPFAIELKWERQTSFVRKYFVSSPLISLEDIQDCDIDILAANVEEIVRAVAYKVDRRIYDVLTEATVSGTPNPTNINTDTATAAWATTGSCNPILDLLMAKRKITAAGYNPKGAIVLMNQLEEQNLINYLIAVKGSSIPQYASEQIRNGVVMSILDLNIVVSPNATAAYVITFVPEKAIKWKTFISLTSVIDTTPGIGKTILCWEEGEALLTDPKAVHCLTTV